MSRQNMQMCPYCLFRPDRYVNPLPRLFFIRIQVDVRKQPELRASTYARTDAFSPHARRSRGVRRIHSAVRCLVVCTRLHCCLPRLRKSPMQAAMVDIAEPASRLSRPTRLLVLLLPFQVGRSLGSCTLCKCNTLYAPVRSMRELLRNDRRSIGV